MFKDINIILPDFTIKCDKLDQSSQIYDVMKNEGIKKSYGYGIIWHNDPKNLLRFLKIGRSSPDCKSRLTDQVGERIVRQLAHVPGWCESTRLSPNGKDFMDKIGVLIKERSLPKNFGKNDITVAVWDITKRMDTSLVLESAKDEVKASEWVEGELAKQHKALFNDELPILNKIDPARSSGSQGYIPKEIEHLFEFEQ